MNSIQSRIPANDFLYARKFAVLRNPWDRFVSTYFHKYDLCQGRTIEEQALLIGELGLSPNDMYPEYIFSEDDPTQLVPRTYPIHHHFLPQLFFIRDSYGRVGVDNILRFERLQEDWSYINDARGSIHTRRLPHILKGNRPFDGYRSYFTKEMRDIIHHTYLDDVIRGNYKF